MRDPGIIVFGDAHYARFWDHVGDVFHGRRDLLNPNAELRRFAGLAAGRHAGMPAVNLGDSVDYYFCNYNNVNNNQENNREDFYNEIIQLSEYYEIPGNHDYRLYPYNLRFWGLDHINVSREERRRFARRLGHHGLRSPLTELRAVARIGAKADPLRGFRGFRQPAFRRIGAFNCIFLNTKSDAMLTAKGFARAAVRLLHDTKAGSPANAEPRIRRIGVDSEGLNESDLGSIAGYARECGDGPVILFMHAPLLNPVCSAIGKSIPLDAGKFRRSRLVQGVGHCVAASGAGGLLRDFQSGNWRERNIAVIAAHVHDARYFLIDRETLVARQVPLRELNGEWNNHRFIKHLTILPLGAIGTAGGERKTGYGRITPVGFEEMVLRRFRDPAVNSARAACPPAGGEGGHAAKPGR